MANNLMFEIGVREVKEKIDDIRAKFDAFEQKYGKEGIHVKIDFKGATTEAENLINALKQVGDPSRLREYEKKIDELKEKLAKLETTAAAAGGKEEESSNKAAAATQRQLKLLSDVENKIAAIKNITARGEGLKLDMSALGVAEQQFVSFYEKLRQMGTLDNGQIKALSAEFSQLKSTFNDVIKESDAFTKSIQKMNTKQASEYAKQHARAEKEDAESMNIAAKAAEQLHKKLELLRIKGVRNNAVSAGVDVSALDAAISRMERYRNVLSYISTNGGHDASRILNSAGFMRASTELSLQVENVKKLTSEQNKNANSTNQLSAEQQRLANALNTSSTAMRGQSQLLGELKTLATQYLGVWGAQNFLNNIIQIGGQLEMQRLSIGAILGDAAHATDLFDQIKSLAIRSPFGVVELDQMSKQLSAYGFQYNELYDMTKRLADISAATGTEVSRLSLALGHVRSEAALSGYTLRQFSMANIPLAKKLSEYLTKIEGKLVSVADVRARVRKKEIGYEEVENVIKDLTNEGGMFYNAQEVMSQSVKAKFKNLKDAMAIMYGEIAESAVGFGLKDIAANLTEITRRWKEVGTAAGTALLVFGGSKAALMTYNALLGKNAAATMSTIAAHRRAEVANLRYAQSYRTLTAAENTQLSTSVRYTMNERLRLATGQGLTQHQKTRIILAREQIIMDNALALSAGKLTAEDIARNVALGNLTKTEARRIIILSDLSAAEKKAGLSAIANVSTYGRMTGVINGLSMAMSRLGAALKSMLLSPQMWIFALIAGVMELWQKNKIENERAQEMNKKLFDRAQEGIKNTRTMLENTGISLRLDGKDISAQNFGNSNVKGASLAFSAASSLSKAEMQTMIDQWTQYIKEYAATPNRIINSAMLDETSGKVRNLTEQYERLRDAVVSVANAQLNLQQVAEAAEIAMNATNGDNGTTLEWFNDDLVENIKDAEKATKAYNNAVALLNNKFPKEVAGILSAAKGNEEYAAAVKALDKELMENEKRFSTQFEQLKLLTEEYGKYGKAMNLVDDFLNKTDNPALGGAWYDITSGGFLGLKEGKAMQMNDAFQTLEADTRRWAQNFRKTMEGYGWKFGEAMGEGQKQAAIQAFIEMEKAAGATSEEIDKKLREVTEEEWGFRVSDNLLEEIKKINDLEEYLKSICGGEWHINIKTASNFGDVIDEIRKGYKNAQEYFNNVKPLMIRMGVDVSGGMKTIDFVNRNKAINNWKSKNPGKDASWLDAFFDQYNDMAAAMSDALAFNKETGISLTDTSKSKAKKSGSGTKKDELADMWTHRVDILKKYRAELEKYEKVMSVEDAVGQLKKNGNFSKMFDEKWFSDPSDFLKSIDEAIKGMGSATKKRQELADKWNTEKQDFIGDKQLKNTENEVSELGRLLSVMKESYDVYKKWVDLTGDEELAANIAGVVHGSSYKDALKSKYAEMGGAKEMSAEEFFGLKESDVKKFGEKSGLYELWKEWQDNLKKIRKEDLELYEDAITNAKGYAEKMDDLNRKLKERLDIIKKTAKSPEEEEKLSQNAIDITNEQKAKLTWENFQKTEEWGRIFSDLDKVSTQTLRRMLEGLKEIAPQIASSVEATKALYEAMGNVEEKIGNRQPFKEAGSVLASMASLRKLMKNGVSGSSFRDNEGNYRISPDEARKLGLSVKESGAYTKEDMSNAWKTLNKKLQTAVEGIVDTFSKLQSGLSLVENLFDAMGNSSAANTAGDMGGILSGALSGASSLSALGPWGMAAGAALGVATAMFQQHDKDIQREIDAINDEVKALDQNTEAIKRARERTLGYDSGDIRRQMQELYTDLSTTRTKKIGSFEWSWTEDSAAKKAMREYYGTNINGNGYSQELANLKKQREDYIKMYDLENDKKKKSQDTLMEYKSKIAELDDQIAYFAQDLANEVYGIDLKGWADEIGDALMTAFENGEDAAEAFRDTVQGIMRKVLREMLSIGIIQPMMEKLQKKLFGENGKGGSFDVMNPEATIDNAMRDVAAFFSTNGEGYAMISATQAFYEKWEEFMRSQGFSLSESESTSSLKNSVKGITENTADLLASYLNATRVDVSVNRALFEQYLPMYYAAMTQGNASLRVLETKAQEIALSNEAIKENTYQVLSLVNGLRLGTWKVPMA